MAGQFTKADLIEYTRNKFGTLLRPVLGVVKFGLPDACDSAIVIQNDSREAQRKIVKIKL